MKSIRNRAYSLTIIAVIFLLAIITVFSVAGCNKQSTGTFYSLQEAYDNGWVTQADIMSIAYYKNRGRTYNEEIMSEDYAPLPKTPEVLSELTELKIKSTAAKEYREIHNIEYAKADDFIIDEYFGTYDDCVAVIMRDVYSGAAGVGWTHSIAGVNLYFSAGREILIWRETK